MGGRRRRGIPADVSAGLLFRSERTCCVCHIAGKPVQIHHIDGNPSNSDKRNLAVLCLDCHTETQIIGGFYRKLSPELVVLYRDDWHKRVARGRALETPDLEAGKGDDSREIELATSLADIYGEKGQPELLAVHYHAIGNYDLRDKYIEEIFRNNPEDFSIVYYRGMQQRPDLIPREVLGRVVDGLMKDDMWCDVARCYVQVRDYEKAAKFYVKEVAESLEQGNLFTAAFYLKQLVKDGVIGKLFEAFYRDESSLWWRVRCLEELGWESELNDLLLQKREEILKSDNIQLKILLSKAEGDIDNYIELMKSAARMETEEDY